MSNKRCPECGFPRESETGDDMCPSCGWNFSSSYEKVEIRNNEDGSTKVVRLLSKKVGYYEYVPNTSLSYEDAWGKCYKGIYNSSSTSTKVSIYKLKTKQHCPEYLLRRLYRESLFCISHTNLIPILEFIAVRDDLNSDDYELYFVEEYFFRVSLSDFLQGKSYTKGVETKRAKELYSLYLRDRAKFARKVITDILQGLVYLHEKGVYMSIIDPEWIYITNDGKVKITTTRRYLYEIYSNKRHYYRMTGSFIGCFPGSWKFISPEIILYEDLMKIDYRSDIYSVGILFFQLLTGHCPYDGELLEILYQQVHAKIPIKEIEDKSLRKCIKRATEKNPAKRYQSASEFLGALEYMGGSVPWYKKIIRIFLSVLCSFFLCPNSDAQTTMYKHYKDGCVCSLGVGLPFYSTQVDDAQKYLREAQRYNEQAERYEREAERLTKKAKDYSRLADSYAKKKDYRQSRLYTNWANDALSKAQLRLKWAKDARNKAKLRMKWAEDAMKRQKRNNV